MIRRNRGVSLLLIALALLTGASACSIPSRPAWWPKSGQSADPGSAANQEDAATDSGVAVVQHPWRTGRRQLGIQVYWTANDNDRSDSMVAIKARRIINYAVSLDANSIMVTFPFYTHGVTSSRVYASSSTPTAHHIEIFLEEAAESHIAVTLRPILNEDALIRQNPLAWRGSIDPASVAGWFHSYRELLMPYAIAAQAGHAASLVVGTELDSLETSRDWPGVIRAIRSVYKGRLVYDQNFNEFAADDERLPLRTFDIDAYPRFSLPDSASLRRLTKAWDGWLGAHPLKVRRQLTLSEVGAAAVHGAYSDPGDWTGTQHSAIDTHVQAYWYRAVCQAIQTEHVGGGVFWWEVSFDADPAKPAEWDNTDRLTFLGRPAQAVIKSCFAKLAA
jgi:hypothetical protein